MRNNPQDWRIEDLKTVAAAKAVEWRSLSKDERCAI
jgi:hypothetical protein